jgi:nucleoside-diphosphate-sugar epimerase
MAVLLTGANGFLGNYLKLSLAEHGLKLLGLSDCDYNVDLSNVIPEFSEPFEKIVHAAGLAHIIPKSKQSKQRFFDVNVNGTSNLLKGLEKLPKLPEIFIFISTIAVYGVDSGENIDETAALKAISTYAQSKAEAEAEVERWCNRNNVRLLILRLPLIVGTNPPGNLGAMIRSIKKGYYFRIGEGKARRSIVLAEDVASHISKCNTCSGIYNLTDGVHPTIRELDEAIAFKCGKRIKVLPHSLVKLAARAGDIIPLIPINSMKLEKLTSTLTFSDVKARRELGWNPMGVVDHIEI